MDTILTETYCTYDMSKKIAALGGDLYCPMAYRWYDEHFQELMSRHELMTNQVAEKYITDAPTLELANKWVRQKFNLEVSAQPSMTPGKWRLYIYDLNVSESDGVHIASKYCQYQDYTYDTKEAALMAGLMAIINDEYEFYQLVSD